MKQIIPILLILFFLNSCKKVEFSDTAQVSFISFTPNTCEANNLNNCKPILKFHLQDANGDFGETTTSSSNLFFIMLNEAGDTISNSPFPFPSMSITNQKNMDVDVDFAIPNYIIQNLGGGVGPRTDIYKLKFYVKDFEGNQSNTESGGHFNYFIP